MDAETKMLAEAILAAEKQRTALRRARKAAEPAAKRMLDPVAASQTLAGFSFAEAALDRDIQGYALAIERREMALLKAKYAQERT